MDGIKDIDRYNNLMIDPSFSLNAVEETIKETLYTSFGYLYQKQVESISLNRSDLSKSDVHVLEDRRFRITIETEMIDHFARERFLKDRMLQKEIDLNTIITRQDIFKWLPVVFIDGVMHMDFTVYPSGEVTQLFFKVNSPINTCQDISVIFVNNSGFYRNIEINKFILDKYSNVLPMSYFSEYANINIDKSFASFNKINNSSAIGVLDVLENGVKIPVDSNDALFSTDGAIFMDVVNMRNIHQHKELVTITKEIEGTFVSKPFIISDGNKTYGSPIPTENIMLFKLDNVSKSYKLVKCDIELHYPNIYMIKDTNIEIGDVFKVFFFYDDDATYHVYENKLLAFFNALASTNTYGKSILSDILESIMTDPSPQRLSKYYMENLLNYNDVSFRYDHGDFNEYINFPYHFDYKVDKLGYISSIDSNILTEYNNNLRYDIDGLYLYTKNINLDSRIRTDNSIEKDSISELIKFDRPQYVFAVQGNFNRSMENYRVFIDGNFFYPKYHGIYYGVQYFYVPTNIVTATSYIEIEIFDSYSRHIEFSMGDTHSYSFRNLSTTLKPNTNDVFFINASTEEFIPDNIIGYNINGVDIEGVTNSHDNNQPILLNGDITFTQPGTTIEGGTPLICEVSKVPNITHFYSGDSFVPGICKLDISTSVPFTFTNLRVFVDGRLYPTSTYELEPITKINSAVQFHIKREISTTSNVYIDRTPYILKEVYFKKELSQNDMDLYLDLKGILNKPFDYKYFDVFLNGKKISRNNLVAITPTKLKLFNLTSKYNLYIIEKDGIGDGEYTDINISDIYDKILESFVPNLTDKIKIIEELAKYKKDDEVSMGQNLDMEDDITTGNPVNLDSFDYVGYYTRYVLTLDKINPDILQLNSIRFDEYPIIKNYVDIDSIGNKVVKFGGGDPTGIVVIKCPVFEEL